MKSLNFKRKETAQLRYLNEKVSDKGKTRLNWDRVVYLSILGLIVFFVLRYFFMHSFYISANGQVLFENLEISHTEDLRISRFFIAEGDEVKEGDTLFTYMIEEIDLESTGDKEKGNTWAEKEMYNLRKDIDLNNSQIQGDRELIASYKDQLSKLETEVMLGAANERDLNNLEYQISKLETSISLAQSENAVLAQQIAEIQSRIDAAVEGSTSLETASLSRAFLSPINGYVSNIYKEPYEVALKSHLIMKIHQADLVHIKGYFDQEDLKYVKEGDHVSVDFPDGSESEGVIDRFYASTVLLPQEFQEKYEPVKRTIAVDIKPAEGSDLDIWKRYYKLSVKLSKSTF